MRKFLFLGIAVLALSCENSSLELKPLELYSNPIVSTAKPDPSVTKGGDENWYLCYTNSSYIPIFKSGDLCSWDEEIVDVFSDTQLPSFIDGAAMSAPDINYVAGNYIIYYSLKSDSDCGIGAAIASTPEGPYTDKGKVMAGSDYSIAGAIQPSLFEENGACYLVCGSFGGIYVIELNADALSVKSGAKPTKIANEAFEAATIFKKGSYYYLFASKGSSEGGASSTHTIEVGRSSSITGPYTDKNGSSMLNGASTNLIGTSVRFSGTGHCSDVLTDDAGDTWIVYNAYQLSSVSSGRCLMMDKVCWKEDWPYVRGGVPSFKNDKPVFNANL